MPPGAEVKAMNRMAVNMPHPILQIHMADVSIHE
eukprot:CAMPEP_0204263100 /NCGR_PEP_ID=MMETSP0468-20130131/8115_1 /ASSEMBLY_ACC=CAM_ASM_000383 /TAXON_ID=2969 /ORGANISM="Oxyrrhis marina" /LENGTH=33 /DNA_ID= /DNA_START= /DNA_END= /DNA_ORIENTATION=